MAIEIPIYEKHKNRYRKCFFCVKIFLKLNGVYIEKLCSEEVVSIKNKDSIQQRIQGYLDQEKINIYQFSQRTGINRGILSRVMNEYPPKLLSLHQYDQITKVFQLPEGTLYSLYREEYFHKQGNWRRLRPFLMRCAALQRFDDIIQ